MLHTLQDATLEEDRRFTIQLLSVDEVEISPVKGERVRHFWKLKSIFLEKCDQIISSYNDGYCLLL